jgi:hypothetical protein
MTRDQRFEQVFLVSSRLAAVAILAITLSFDLLSRLEVISLPEADDWPADGQWSRSALIDLTLLICICSPTLARWPAAPSLRRTLINIAAGVAAIAWALIALTESTFIHFLVFLAVQGMESAQPARFVHIAPQQSEWAFAYHLIAESLLVSALAFLLRALARHWSARLRWRIALVAGLLLGILWLAVQTWGLITHELREISPGTFEGIEFGPVHRWLASAVLLIVCCVAWSYLQLRAASSSAPAPVKSPAELTIDESVSRMLSPILVLLLYSALAVPAAIDAMDPFGNATEYDWSSLLSALAYPQYFLQFAVWLTAAVQLWRNWKSRGNTARLVLYGVAPTAFFTVASLSVLLGAVGGAVLAWTSFALWLTPWYVWP